MPENYFYADFKVPSVNRSAGTVLFLSAQVQEIYYYNISY